MKKATGMGVKSTTPAMRRQDLIGQYHAARDLARAVRDPTPGHIVNRLLDGERMTCSAIPASDLAEDFDLTCEYCGMAVVILHSMGPALPLVRHPLYFNRHSCPKTVKHNGVFLK
jgi:hypothetical protein